MEKQPGFPWPRAEAGEWRGRHGRHSCGEKRWAGRKREAPLGDRQAGHHVLQLYGGWQAALRPHPLHPQV